MQQLPFEFRENYAKFWMSIVHANVQEMQKHSEKLGVKELYSYFACMVSGRSMTSVLGGKVIKTKTSEEEKQIKVDASVYLVSDKFFCRDKAIHNLFYFAHFILPIFRMKLWKCFTKCQAKCFLFSRPTTCSGV